MVPVGDGHSFYCAKGPITRVRFRFTIDGHIRKSTIRQTDENKDCGVNSDDDERRGY